MSCSARTSRPRNTPTLHPRYPRITGVALLVVVEVIEVLFEASPHRLQHELRCADPDEQQRRR